MMSVAMSAAVVAVVGLASGCGDAAAQVCIPGQSNICFCSANTTSFQSCNLAGTGYDPCNCGNVGADAGNTDPGPPKDIPQADPGPGVDTGPAGDVAGCLPKYFKGCVGTEAWWFDSCEQPDEYIENCPKQCANGTCVEFCDHKAYEDCSGNDVWWFDSCGVAETLSKACDDEQFCANKTCIKPFYNGTWRVTADPDTKMVAGIMPATFPPSNLSLSVTGTTAAASLTAQGITVNYAGPITGKQMFLEATYVGLSGESHVESWDVTFVDLNTFEGTIVDKMDLPTFGPVTLIWDGVTGVKQ
jgi:hypothetical protein